MNDKPNQTMPKDRSALVVGLYFVCSVFFGIDIIVEVTLEFGDLGQISYFDALHLVMEILAEGALILAVILSLSSYFRLKETSEHSIDLVRSIRTGFDRALNQKFDDWGLTEAQKDIALLSARGESISQIAEIRDTRGGTVKAHLHNIYKKAAVGSRTELLAVLMDELLSSQAATGEEGEEMQAGYGAG